MTMQEPYNAKTIEVKWQKKWQNKNLFKANSENKNKNYYVLEMFPYPSGKIHMGHVRVYSLGDVLARYKRAKGYNVLHPMGWDAFGMPAENAAFENKIHPATWTKNNIDSMRTQLKAMGLSYDWELEFATCDPPYIKAQQKIFLDLYKNNLAYRQEAWANWDPIEQTVLANEQVINGKGWRSGATVQRKKLPQWFFRITKYADDLIDSLGQLENWSEQVKTMQKNWIGRSEGIKLEFQLDKSLCKSAEIDKIEVYTTRPDTIFGASFIALAPDHPISRNLYSGNKDISEFIDECNEVGTSEQAIEKVEKKGIDTKLKVYHPFLPSVYLPVYIANFVLMSYGTGAIFGVPAHDQRDLDFANKINLPVKVVVESDNTITNKAYTGPGKIINSEFLNGLSSTEAKKKIIELSKKLNIGKITTQYRLHDWCASRQRYWGCPVPIILCESPKCGIIPVPDKELPVLLPQDVSFDKIGNPLDHHMKWKNVSCPKCGKPAKRETQTFDTFVDSAWYPLRYTSPKYDEPIEKAEMEKWCPVQQYIGGIEHAILHLLYARFFHRALKDLNYINFKEPFSGVFCQGMVCHKTYQGPDGWLYPEEIYRKGNKIFRTSDNAPVKVGRSEKMSKSKKNIIDPLSIIEQYGADTARLFILSDSPPERDLDWSESGVEGTWKFLRRLWNHFKQKEFSVKKELKTINLSQEAFMLRQEVHQLIKLTSENYESFRFNSAVANIRKLSNILFDKDNYSNKYEKDVPEIITEGWESFLIMLAPITPHIAEELWKIMGNKGMICSKLWPSYDKSILKLDSLIIPIQINGKLKNTISIKKSEKGDKEAIISKVKEIENIKRILVDKTPKKIIFIPGKVINIVI